MSQESLQIANLLPYLTQLCMKKQKSDRKVGTLCDIKPENILYIYLTVKDDNGCGKYTIPDTDRSKITSFYEAFRELEMSTCRRESPYRITLIFIATDAVNGFFECQYDTSSGLTIRSYGATSANQTKYDYFIKDTKQLFELIDRSDFHLQGN